MCGIAGIVGNIPSGGDEIRRMVELLHHRGPDDSGIWKGEQAQIAHARLSILDLSAAGHQPMEYKGRILSYNGEIYNYRQLAKTLSGPFQSKTDSEVLLHLYDRDEKRCLHRLTGMFAFAIWDTKQRRLFAARDRLGIKPLFYREIPGGLAFASEIKSLLVLGKPPIREEGISDYLSYRYIPSPETIYEGIYKLPPAHFLLWEDGRLHIERYWQPPETPEITREGPALEELHEILSEVIPDHALADVPLGVFLSGGLDSATITSYLDHPRSFTLGTEIRRHDERVAAARVAKHFNTRHREEIAGAPDLSKALGILPGLFDEPFSDSGAWASYMISSLARKDVTVALSGEGGDELFLGYKRHGAWRQMRGSRLCGILSHLVHPLTDTGRSLQRRAQSGFENYAELSSGFTRRQKALLLPKGVQERDDYWFFRKHWREDLEPYQRLRWLDIHTYLPEDLLVKLDRVSMAHSLEARPALLDHRLVEFAMKLSPSLLRHPQGAQGKLLLRRLMLDRLPPGHLDRAKMGFNLPIRSWVRKNPEILHQALNRLADAGHIRRPRIFRAGNEQTLSILLLDRFFHGETGAEIPG